MCRVGVRGGGMACVVRRVLGGGSRWHVRARCFARWVLQGLFCRESWSCCQRPRDALAVRLWTLFR